MKSEELQLCHQEGKIIFHRPGPNINYLARTNFACFDPGEKRRKNFSREGGQFHLGRISTTCFPRYRLTSPLNVPTCSARPPGDGGQKGGEQTKSGALNLEIKKAWKMF